MALARRARELRLEDGPRARLALAAAVMTSVAACTDASGSSSPTSPPAPSAPPRVEAPASATAPVPSAAERASEATPPPQGPPEGMVLVTKGIFLMGSPLGSGDIEERPAFEVVQPSFYLDRTEVTVDAYAACVSAGACKPPRDTHPFCNARFPSGRGDHPVNCVDHADATAYCAFVGKRLPTEREWEYAASNGAEKRRFAWGNEDPDRTRACYAHEGTCPVGSFAPTAFGLLDMSGNVWEWTDSWFAPYPDEATTGLHRVYRGGSWSRRFPKWLRNSLRNRYRPDEWSASLGFRCAKSKLPLDCPDEAEPRGERCVRVRGTPLCDPTVPACALGAGSAGPLVPAGMGPRARVPASPPSNEHGTAAPVAGQPVTIGRSRAPQFDADCRAHYTGKPHAYTFTGGDFHDREPMVRASGCSKRDTGRGWTSVCCAE